MKLAKNLENLGTEKAFAVLAEAKALEGKRKSNDPYGSRTTLTLKHRSM
jgi:hypothetical protein